MRIEFLANRRDGSSIQFSVDIDTGRVDNVAYEYQPGWNSAVPIRFDRVSLLGILNSDDYEFFIPRSNPLTEDRFIKKSLNQIIRRI